MSIKHSISSCTKLTAALDKAFSDLMADAIDVAKADAAANIAGKVVKANVAQLAYYQERKDGTKLPFWELD